MKFVSLTGQTFDTMFSRQLTDKLYVSLSIPQFAEEIFALTDKNRLFLRRWLPWLDTVTQAAHTREFINLQLRRFACGESLHLTIFSEGKVAGVAGYNSIDYVNGIGTIGYWQGEESAARES